MDARCSSLHALRLSASLLVAQVIGNRVGAPNLASLIGLMQE